MASGGLDGLAELERADSSKPFDLVLMDWKMPDLDGLTASGIIKKHRMLSKIPAVIMVTAYSREEIAPQAEQIGLDGILLKPASPCTGSQRDHGGFRSRFVARASNRDPILSGQKRMMSASGGANILLVEGQ